jgi:hypothetical protein
MYANERRRLRRENPRPTERGRSRNGDENCS